MLGNQTFEVLQPLSKLSHQGWKVFEFVVMFSNLRNFRYSPVQEFQKWGDSDGGYAISRRCPSGTSTSKFWKSCWRHYFMVTLDENPHLRKAEAYFSRSGSISSKKSSISILSAILVKLARTPFKLHWNVWLPSMSCLRPIRTCFSVTCLVREIRIIITVFD